MRNGGYAEIVVAEVSEIAEMPSALSFAHAAAIPVGLFTALDGVASALGVKWTREPGDHIIRPNAIANNQAPLVTADRLIHKEYLN